MSKSIVMEIAPDGTVKIEAVGYKGCGCAEATKALEEAMGKATQRTKKTPDWYVQEVSAQKAGAK